MEHFPFAPLSSLWTWTRHALEIPREMQPDWGTDPPLTLDKEEASMLGFRVSVTPSPPRKTQQEKTDEISRAVESCDRRIKETTSSSETSSPASELPHPRSSPSFSKIYRQQEVQEDENDGTQSRDRLGDVANSSGYCPPPHRGERAVSRGSSAIAALAEYGSSPPLTPAGKRCILGPASFVSIGLHGQPEAVGERLPRLPLGVLPVNTASGHPDPGTSSSVPRPIKPQPSGKKKRKKAPRKTRKRSRDSEAENKPPLPQANEAASATLADTPKQTTRAKRPQLSASHRVSDDAAGLDLLALAAVTTTTDPPELSNLLTFDEDGPQGNSLACESRQEDTDPFYSIARATSGGSIMSQHHQGVPGLIVEVEDLADDDGDVIDDMGIPLHDIDAIPDDGVMGDLLESVEEGLNDAAMLGVEQHDVIHIATGDSGAMVSPMHDSTPQWSLSQPPSAIFGTDKILPVQTTSIPSSDTFEPTSELDIDSAASTPLNLRRIFAGQLPKRLMGSRSSETNEPHYSAPDSPTPAGKRFTGGKRPRSPEILCDEKGPSVTRERAGASSNGTAGVKRWRHGRPFEKETTKPDGTRESYEFAPSIAERAKRTRPQAANPITPISHHSTSRLRLTAKPSAASGPAKTPHSPLKKTLSGSSSGTCFEPATPDRESSPESDFEASFKPSNRSFQTPKYPRKSYTPVELDIIAKYWQGGTDPIRLEILDKICAELKQKGFKRTRDALKTHMGTNLRTVFAQRFRKNFTHTTRGIPVRSCSFDT